MKPLVKIMFLLAALFASTLLVLKLTGLLSVPQIENWMNNAHLLSPWLVGLLVAGLLLADLLIAVPTMTICILAGYFLGFPSGSAAAIIGMMLAGTTGHILSRFYGLHFMRFVTKDEDQINTAITTFSRHGFTMILLSRAVPILPEVTACLSGATGMSLPRFILAWSISSVPYALITTYAGSISSISNPKPALFTAALLSAFLWFAWFTFHRQQRQTKRRPQ